MANELNIDAEREKFYAATSDLLLPSRFDCWLAAKRDIASQSPHSIGEDAEFKRIGDNLLQCVSNGARVRAFNDLVEYVDAHCITRASQAPAPSPKADRPCQCAGPETGARCLPGCDEPSPAAGASIDTIALGAAKGILPLYFEAIPGVQLQAKIQCAVRDAIVASQSASAKDAADYWISVKDRLPSEGDLVLICGEIPADVVSKFDCWRTCATFRDGDFLNANGCTQNSATHWQRLPAAPARAAMKGGAA